MDDALAGFVLLRLLGIEQTDGVPGVLPSRGLHGHNSGGLALLAQTDLIGGDSGVCSLSLQVFSYHVSHDFLIDILEFFTCKNFEELLHLVNCKDGDILWFCLFTYSGKRLYPCDKVLLRGFIHSVAEPIIYHFDDLVIRLVVKICRHEGDHFLCQCVYVGLRYLTDKFSCFLVSAFRKFAFDLRPLCRDLFFCRFRAGVGISDLCLADRDGQIIAGAHVAQYVAVAAAGQCPELSAVGGGVLQHQCAVNDRQTLAIRGGQGVFAGIVVGQDQLRGLLLGHQVGAAYAVAEGPAVGVIAQGVFALQVGGGVLIAHDQRIGRLVDVQAAVYRGLHIAVRCAVIGHGTVLHAIAVRQLGLHILILVVQLAALSVDGLDQLRLALHLEAAQPVVDGAGDHVIGAVHAMLDAAAPQDVLQGDGVVIQVQGRVFALQAADQGRVALGTPVLCLGVGKLTLVDAVAQLPPGVLKVGAVACCGCAAGVLAVGLIQRGCETIVYSIALVVPQPGAERVQRSRLAGEHIQAEGRAAGVAVHVGNGSRVGIRTRLVILAQRAQFRVCPILTGSQQYGGQTAHRHHRRQDQCHSPFRPLHVDTPCLISKLYGKRRRREGPPPIYITIVMCSIPSVCVVVYQKNEKNTKNMKILSPAPQDLGGFMARNGV